MFTNYRLVSLFDTLVVISEAAFAIGFHEISCVSSGHADLINGRRGHPDL